MKGLTVLKQVDEGEQFEDEEDDWKEPLRALANPCTGPGSSYEALSELRRLFIGSKSMKDSERSDEMH